MTTKANPFQKYVDSGNPVGEVIGVDHFLIKIKGLQPVNHQALIMFEDGSQGFVHQIKNDYILAMHLGSEPIRIGAVAVVCSSQLVANVGKEYIGRVISVTGEPLDGKGPIKPDASWPIFYNAPMLYERELLDKQLETGITVIDTMFSLVRGQRMAVLGDSKSGKSTLAAQIAIHQRGIDVTAIYVLIAKRYSDVSELIDRLEAAHALDETIVVVSTMTDSLAVSYLAPYVACAMGEYLWQKCNTDTLIIYDDLTNHAQVHREISLMAGVSPGRDSYPGDIFYTHSMLIERAGKLATNHKTQTILPLVYSPAGDITAYLPTNIMSMTDGQWILDMEVFRGLMRPAVSTGLSVSRVGGVGQSPRQKKLAQEATKAIANYKQISEFTRFGTDFSAQTQFDLETGQLLFNAMNQIPIETYDVMAQQLILDIILHRKANDSIDISKLKQKTTELSQQIEDDVNYKQAYDQIYDFCSVNKMATETPA